MLGSGAAGAQVANGPSSIVEPMVTLAPNETLLEVTATGTVSSRPDLMTFSAGVVTTGATTEEAIRANGELATRLIDAVRASGVAAKDVKTERLELFPRITDEEEERADREGGAPRISGYVARNRLEIRLRDLDRASDVMEQLFSAGANEVQGPYFSLQDPTPSQRLAERRAIEAARAEAENYAAALGKRVSRILRASERGTRTQNFEQSIVVTGGTGRNPIEPGEIHTNSTVYVDFALVD